MADCGTGTDYGRVLELAVGDPILVLVNAGLVALATHLRANAYLWPAAIGLVLGFTDINLAYLVDQTGVGAALFAETLILFGAPFGNARARRRPELTVPAAAS